MLQNKSNIYSTLDDTSSIASSEEGSEYVVSDSDMEPEALEDAEEKECQEPVTEEKKSDEFCWFQATDSNQMVCDLCLL